MTTHSQAVWLVVVWIDLGVILRGRARYHGTSQQSMADTSPIRFSRSHQPLSGHGFSSWRRSVVFTQSVCEENITFCCDCTLYLLNYLSALIGFLDWWWFVIQSDFQLWRRKIVRIELTWHSSLALGTKLLTAATSPISRVRWYSIDIQKLMKS